MKIFIEKPFMNMTDSVKIYVIDEKNGRRSEIKLDRKSNNLIATVLDDNAANQVEPFLELPMNFFDDFVRAIVKYASENDIKTENENLLQGKLKATEKHLEDLRNYFDKALIKITQ